MVVLDQRDENLEVNRRRHGEKKNLFLIRGNFRRQMQSLLGGKEYKGKERAAEELDALYKAGFDYVILPSMLPRQRKAGQRICSRERHPLCETGGKLLAAAENESGVRYFMGAEPFEHSF